MFSVPQDEADRLTAEFLRDEPHRIASLELAGNASQRSQIELPAESSAELRRFIKKSESLLISHRDSSRH